MAKITGPMAALYADRFVNKDANCPVPSFSTYTICDVETGVEYLVVQSDHNVAVTPLLNSDGTPYIREGWRS